MKFHKYPKKKQVSLDRMCIKAKQKVEMTRNLLKRTSVSIKRIDVYRQFSYYFVRYIRKHIK